MNDEWQECRQEIADAVARHARLNKLTARCLIDGSMDAGAAKQQAAADLDHLNDVLAEIRHRYGAPQP